MKHSFLIFYCFVSLLFIINVSFFSGIAHADIVCPEGQIPNADFSSCTEDPAVDKYIYLAPLPCAPGSSEGCVCNGPTCTLQTFDPAKENALGDYLNIMLRIFIGICAVLAVIMIVVGGIEYMTSDLMSSKEEGRHRISGAVFGLLLALGSWLLLNQINPNLLNTDIKLRTAQVEVDLSDNVAQVPVGGKYSNGAAYGASWETTSGMTKAVLPTWASLYNSECTTVGQTNCTSTRGLTGQYLNSIHANCPTCELVITGGTEFWLHGGKTGSTSHKPGSPTVDLRINDALTKYIAGDKPLVYFKRYEKDGISFLYEKNHWHVGP